MSIAVLVGCSTPSTQALSSSSEPVTPNIPLSEPSPSPTLVFATPQPNIVTIARINATPIPIKTNIVRNDQVGRALLKKLLPHGIPEREGWKNDIFSAFHHLSLPYTKQNFCAVMAIAEQESSYNSDPVTPNLSAIVWDEIENRRKKYLIPSFVIETALLKSSPDGRVYKDRINALRTKKQMNVLYEDMVQELPFGSKIFEHKNPIRDAGPMQVSVAFAETHIRAWPYPYSYKNLRDEVFTRRGSVYFGAAIMLQYPAAYSDMIYRFADYNAGRYSSRNAAFQAALSLLTNKQLAQDGDLILYLNKMERIPSGEESEVQQRLFSLRAQLHLSPDEIICDLRQEKLAEFAQTPLYKRVYELANQKSGKNLPHEAIPQIVLISPKITHHLTTEWFAHKVNDRYQRCIIRDLQ